MTANAKVSFKINEPCAVPKQAFRFASEGSKVVVTYSIPEMSEVRDSHTGEFLYHQIPGFGQCSEESKPRLPMRIDTYYVPDGYELTVSASGIPVDTVDCGYLPVIAPLSDSHSSSTDDGSLTPYSGSYPQKTAFLTQAYKLRGKIYADVAVSPIQYDYQNHCAYIYDHISYTLNYTPVDYSGVDPDGGASLSSSIPQIVGFRNILLTQGIWGSLRAYDPFSNVSKEGPIGYIIVTTDEFLPEIERFVQWKRITGYDIHFVTQESWSDWEDVQAAIRECRSSNKDAAFLLIVGDIDDVPARRVPKNVISSRLDYPAHYTDSQYGTMDDNSYVPDILMGRISVDATGVRSVVEKIVDVEMCPIQDESFYQNAAHISYFEGYKDKYDSTKNDSTKESSRFILTSEELRDYVSGFGIEASRIYGLEPNSTPLKYNPVYSIGDSIPDSLRIPNFNWGCTATNVADKINNGIYYALYRGHGSVSGWSNVGFRSSGLGLLHNRDKYPIVFSMTCSTGDFNDECFAEKLLTLPESGACAVIAASEKSWSGYNDALIEGMFDAIWPEPGIIPKFGSLAHNQNIMPQTPEPTYLLGQIMQQGLFRMKEQFVRPEELYTQYQYEIFHLFGDPGMYFHTEMPKPFDNVTVQRDDDCIYVNTNEKDATISFYNCRTQETHRYESNDVSLYTDEPDNIYVCVNAHNRLPYIDTMIMTGNEETVVNPKIKKAVVKNAETASIQVFTGSLNRNLEIKIFDTTGTVIASGTVEMLQNLQDLDLPLNCPRGVYIVSLIYEANVIDTAKIIK